MNAAVTNLETPINAIPTLVTPRLTLVAPSLAHLQAERDFWVSDRSRFVGGPLAPHRAWRVLGLHLGHWQINGYGMFSVLETATQTPVGMVGLWGPEPWPEPELSYHLYAGFEGKGYVQEAARAVMVFNRDVLGRDRLCSMIDPENAASQAVATRLGAQNSGEKFDANFDGKTVDIWRYDADALRAVQIEGSK